MSTVASRGDRPVTFESEILRLRQELVDLAKAAAAGDRAAAARCARVRDELGEDPGQRRGRRRGLLLQLEELPELLRRLGPEGDLRAWGQRLPFVARADRPLLRLADWSRHLSGTLLDEGPACAHDLLEEFLGPLRAALGGRADALAASAREIVSAYLEPFDPDRLPSHVLGLGLLAEAIYKGSAWADPLPAVEELAARARAARLALRPGTWDPASAAALGEELAGIARAIAELRATWNTDEECWDPERERWIRAEDPRVWALLSPIPAVDAEEEAEDADAFRARVRGEDGELRLGSLRDLLRAEELGIAGRKGDPDAASAPAPPGLPPIDNEVWIGQRDACAMLGWSPSTFKKHRREGRFPQPRQGKGKSYLWPALRLIAYGASQSVPILPALDALPDEIRQGIASRLPAEGSTPWRISATDAPAHGLHVGRDGSRRVATGRDGFSRNGASRRG